MNCVSTASGVPALASVLKVTVTDWADALAALPRVILTPALTCPATPSGSISSRPEPPVTCTPMPPSPRVRLTSEAAILITVLLLDVFAAPVVVARWNEKMPDSDCPRTLTVTGSAAVPICASSDPGENWTSIAIPLPKLMSLGRQRSRPSRRRRR